MTRSPSTHSAEKDPLRRLVKKCFQREAGLSVPIPDENADLIETGILDSMGWVSFLRTVESASGAGELGSSLSERSASFATVLAALRNRGPLTSDASHYETEPNDSNTVVPVILTGSSAGVGSRIFPSEEADRAFGMPAGKLRNRAGIESLAYAAEGENELTLAATAAQEALRVAACGAQELDWIVATSETHHDYPSLSAQLHSRLLVRENCGALDVGGACLGLLNALVVAQSLIGSGQAQTVAVVTADVHIRTLTPGRVAGEFGAPVPSSFEAPLEAVPAKTIASVNSSLAVRDSMLPLSKSAIRRMATSPCSLTAKPFPVQRSPAWKK